jgi:hypothetical protein
MFIIAQAITTELGGSFFMLKDKIQKLTALEIQELKQDSAMRILEKNTNTLGEIEGALFDEIEELGKARIKVEQLKSLKNTLIEQNRALKAVISSG